MFEQSLDIWMEIIPPKGKILLTPHDALTIQS